MNPIVLFSFLLFFIFSCIEYPEYSNIPKVEYTHSYLALETDDLGNKEKIVYLNFMLYDGDGNIGSNDSTKTNFFSEFYVKKNGRFIHLDSLITDNSNYIIPQLRNGEEKFIKAEVTVTIAHSALLMPYDTLFISFFVVDEAGNKSNTDSTNVLIF